MNVKVPTSWKDVTVDQYDELRQWDFNTIIISKLINHLNGETSYDIDPEDFKNLIKVLSILLDISEDIIMKMEIDSLKVILSKLDWVKPIKTHRNWSINFGKEIKVGDFIDLESIIDSGFDSNFTKFVTRLYGKDMSSSSILDVQSDIEGYLSWRKQIFDDYSGLFESSDDDEDEEILNKRELSSSDFNKRWGWYGLISTLSDGDILREVAVTEINFIQALNHLSYKKEKSFLNKN